MTSNYRFPNDATPPGAAAYYAVRFSPPDVRDDLAVLFAWQAEIQHIRTVSDAGVARAKLTWWRDEVGRASLGEATHPLAMALGGVLARTRLPAAAFDRIADAVGAHLSSAGHDTAAQIARYHRSTGGAFAGLIAELVAGRTGATEAVSEAGAFQAAVDTLGRLGAELATPVPLVPRAVLELHPAAENAALLVADLCNAAEALLPAGAHDLPPPVSGLTALASARLQQIRRAGPLVLQAEVDLTPIRKLWIVWRHR